MNLGDIFKKVGGAILRDVVPGGGLILDVVNEFLPEDEKLKANATGTEIQNAIASLPPEQQAQIIAKEFDVQIEEVRSWATIQGSLAEADAKGASTRPSIAMMMAWVVTLAALIVIASWAVAIHTDDSETVKALSDSWPFILSVLGTPAALLRAYFGMRTEEKKARYNMANGHPTMGILGAIASKVIGKG